MKITLLKKYILACVLHSSFQLALLGQPGPPTPVPTPKSETMKGVVKKVEIYRGMGPGQLLMKTAKGDEVFVLLGSIRYLMQNGFNLTAGDDIEVRGVKSQQTNRSEFIAIEIKNLTNKKSLRLRDENLRPLWRRGGNAQQ
jgi:hypothetical protein